MAHGEAAAVRWMAARVRQLQKRVDILQDLVVDLLKLQVDLSGDAPLRVGAAADPGDHRINLCASDVPLMDDEETEQSDDQHDEQITQELKTHRGCELGQVDPDHPMNENFGDPSGNTNEDQDLAEPSPDEVEASCGGEPHWYDAPSMAPLWVEVPRERLRHYESSAKCHAAAKLQGKAFDQYTVDDLLAAMLGQACPLGDSKVAALWLAYQTMREALPAIDDLLWGGGASGLKRYSFCRRRRMREKGKGMDILRGRVLRS